MTWSASYGRNPDRWKRILVARAVERPCQLQPTRTSVMGPIRWQFASA
jgi:hypothetical protein